MIINIRLTECSHSWVSGVHDLRFTMVRSLETWWHGAFIQVPAPAIWAPGCHHCFYPTLLILIKGWLLAIDHLGRVILRGSWSLDDAADAWLRGQLLTGVCWVATPVGATQVCRRQIIITWAQDCHTATLSMYDKENGVSWSGAHVEIPKVKFIEIITICFPLITGWVPTSVWTNKTWPQSKVKMDVLIGLDKPMAQICIFRIQLSTLSHS